MTILVLGADGRAHALTNAYAQSKKVKKIFAAPGNDFMTFTNAKIQTIPSVSHTDLDGVIATVKKHKVDLVDVANDEPLALGFVDQLTKAGIKAFGPTQSASQIEWSKEWARNFMQKYKLPIPRFKTFTNTKDAIGYVHTLPEQSLFVKASGLALGKGAIRAGKRKQAIEAIHAMRQFGKAGETFLIEECLIGEEFSLFAICDGNSYSILTSAQDHKTVFNANEGPNTGGIGCVSPTHAVTTKTLQGIEAKILKPFLSGMTNEGRPYSGILYVGGMITNNTIKIVEFNARWGDPEAQVIIPGIKNNYLDLIESALDKKLKTLTIRTDGKVRVSVAGCARGYPSDYSNAKGKEIFGLEKARRLPEITIFGAGIKRQGKKWYVNGGRIFHLVAQGKDILDARKKAYEAMSLIFVEGNNLHYRTDIGWNEVERTYQ